MSNRHRVLVPVRILILGVRSRWIYNVTFRPHYSRDTHRLPTVQRTECASELFWIGKKPKLYVSLRLCGNTGRPANYFCTCRVLITVARGLRSTPPPITCWDDWFESLLEHGYLSVVCVVRYRSLLLARHSSRGVLPSVGCLSVIVKPRQ